VGISHETIYRHVYADKAAGGSLYQHLRFQTKRKKRYVSGHVRRSQMVDGRPISERPVCIEARSQIGHWENDTVIGVHHKQAVVTIVERKSGYAVIAKVINKTSDLVSAAIINKLSPMASTSQNNDF
jgi:IS30 family transposase